MVTKINNLAKPLKARLVCVFKNWKLLFKNICGSTCGWKSVLKCVKCCLKTENGYLKIQTKHPLKLAGFSFMWMWREQASNFLLYRPIQTNRATKMRKDFNFLTFLLRQYRNSLIAKDELHFFQVQRSTMFFNNNNYNTSIKYFNTLVIFPE